jgi:hypothetical protein
MQSSWYYDLVGRAPWPAADPLVGLLGRVHSTLWLRLCCLVGQAFSLPPLLAGPPRSSRQTHTQSSQTY